MVRISLWDGIHKMDQRQVKHKKKQPKFTSVYNKLGLILGLNLNLIPFVNTAPDSLLRKIS